MHDRAARPTGAVKSAVAIAIEIMILLSIDLRIAQVRPRVEEKRSPHQMGTLCSSAETADATAADFRLLFYKVLRGRRLEFISTKRRQT